VAQCHVVVNGDGSTDEAWEIFKDTSDVDQIGFGAVIEES
jgi:hypothetical protein